MEMMFLLIIKRNNIKIKLDSLRLNAKTECYCKRYPPLWVKLKEVGLEITIIKVLIQLTRNVKIKTSKYKMQDY